MPAKYILKRRLALAVIMLSSAGAFAEGGHKTPAECNSELYSHFGAIRAFGETPAHFVHDCWWHAAPGSPTPLSKADSEHETPADQSTETATGLVGLRSHTPHRVAETAHHANPLHRRMTPKTPVIRLAQKNRRRFAQTARRHRATVAQEVHMRHVNRQFAANETLRRRHLHSKVAIAEPLRRTRSIRPQKLPLQDGASQERELKAAAAALGPTARVGSGMWVQVVAAEGAQVKRALYLGGLPEGAQRVSALNCWSQPVLYVHEDEQRWSRSMVCDGKPAEANEWAAQIYYSAPDPVSSQ